MQFIHTENETTKRGEPSDPMCDWKKIASELLIALAMSHIYERSLNENQEKP